jgi:glycerol-3-phosphate acyltransferase PlsY
MPAACPSVHLRADGGAPDRAGWRPINLFLQKIFEMTAPFLVKAALPAAAYLLGSIPFGLVLSMLFAGVDIRRHGSGNIGATNVARVCGWPPAVLTLAGDVLKGFLPVYAAGLLTTASGAAPGVYPVVVGLAAFGGHLYPLYLKLNTGGKGVATAAGVFLALSPETLLAALAAFVLLVSITRRASAGSLAASLTLAPAAWWASESVALCACAAVIGAFIVGRHRTNIARLLKGTEPVLFGRADKQARPGGGESDER